MLKFVTTSVVFILFISNIGFSQSTFLGTYNMQGGMMSKQLSDGNFICGGNSFSALFVMKLTPQGQIIWQYQTSFSAAGGFSDIEELVDGNLLFLIGTPPPASSYVLKLDSGGNLVWSRHYSTLMNNMHGQLEPMPDTGFIMIADGTNPGAQLTRCRKDGTIFWQNNYSDTSSGNAFFFSRFELTDNGRNIFLCGSTISSSTESDVFVSKIDTSGNMLWFKEYSIPGTKNNCTSLSATFNGFAIGIQYILPSPSFYWGTCGIAEFDTSGTLLWASQYQYPNTIWLTEIVQQSDSSFVLGGFIPSPLDTNRQWAALVGTDPNGQHTWTHAFSDSLNGNTGAQGVFSLTVLPQNEIFMTGAGTRIPVGRFTSQGYGMCSPVWFSPQTSFIIPPPPNLRSTSVGVDSWAIDTPSVSLTGLSYQPYISCSNIITPVIEVSSYESAIWYADCDLTSNSWTISGPTDQSAEITIFDFAGRMVYQSEVTEGHRIAADIFPGGVYLYRISSGSAMQSCGKLVAH